jgi:hypothetical protein
MSKGRSTVRHNVPLEGAGHSAVALRWNQGEGPEMSGIGGKASAAIAIGLLTATVAVGAGPGGVRAMEQTVTVTNRADDGSPTSLRAAIDQANAAPGDEWTIVLQGGAPYVIERQCLDGDPDDNHGGDLDLVTNDQVFLRAEHEQTPATIEVRCAGERAIDVSGAGQFFLFRVRITGGNLANGANGEQNGDRNGRDAEAGGGLRADGPVVLVSTEFDNNRTGRGGSGAPPLVPGNGGYGGTGGRGSAVHASTIYVANSTFTNNRTGDGGAGGNGVGGTGDGGNGGAGGNGTLSAFNSITIESSVIDGNATGNGGKGGQSAQDLGGNGGIGGNGGGVFTSSLTMTGTSVVRNVAGNGGSGGAGPNAGGNGGRGGFGGGVYAEVGSLHSSTIADNAAGAGGPGAAGVPPGNPGSTGIGGGIRAVPGPGLEMSFVTITGNSAGAGANLAVPAITPSFASIIGDAQLGPMCESPITSLGRNVFGGEGCGNVASDVVLASPLPLGPLGDNGGTTRNLDPYGDVGTPMPTRLPAQGSAIDGLVPLAECDAIGDQRGHPRPSGDCEPGAVELPGAATSVYVPVSPQRVFDTRQPGPLGGFVPAGGTISAQFAGVAGVPADATAVAFNLTITQSGGSGFVTAYPSGTAQPLASNLNTVRAGQDVPNFVMVPLGADGKVNFFTYGGGHLLADVAGYFEPASVAAAGRIVAMDPTRVLDTRQPGPLQGKVAPGGTVTFGFTDLDPTASAVVLNVTGTEAGGAGFVTAYPGGGAQPNTSTLNLAGPGHTAANAAIVPLGPDRTVSLFSDSGAHLVVDITGYVTGPGAEVTSMGLTVPMDPVRVFDTRSGAAIPAGGAIEVPTAGTVGIPADAGAVLLNITATNAAAPGYITGWPGGAPQPVASLLNLTEVDETRANAAILPVGASGGISYFSDAGTHLLADAFGYLFDWPTVPKP